MAARASRLGSERGPGLALGIAALVVFGIVSGVGVAIGEVEATVAALTVIAVVAAIADFRIGAVLAMVLLPIDASRLSAHNVFGLTGLNPLNLVLATTFASYFVRGHGLTRLVPKQVLWLVIVPVLVAGLIGMPHVEDIHPVFYEHDLIHFTDGWGYLRDLAIKPLFGVFVALLVAAAVARAKKTDRFIVPIIITVWMMSLAAIIYVLASGVSLGMLASDGARAFFSGLGMHANDFGRLFAVAYGLLLFTWGETRVTALKSVLVATMVVLTIALVLTFSRGAFIGWAIINALFLVWKMNARNLGLGLLAAAVGAALMPGAVLSRLSLGFGAGGDMNEVSAGRIDEIWTPLLPELFKSPIWGNGLDSIMWSHAIWADQILPVTHPHNAYMQAVLDMGLLGLALLFAFYWHVYRNFRDLGSNAYLSPTMRGFYQGAVAGLVCFFITGIAGSSLRPVPEFAFLWIAIGMMYGEMGRKPAGVQRQVGGRPTG